MTAGRIPAPMTRRSFLGSTSAAGAILATGAALGENSQSANERLSIGIIGAGSRGSALMGQISSLADEQNVAITAICDVWKVNLAKAADTVERSFQSRPRTFTRFADLLQLKDIDAVVIATPDFGHTPILLAALEANKDAYVEKPMSLDVDEANQALTLAEKKQRVVQVGTQRRSDGHFIAARDLLKTGVLGKVSRVDSAVHFNGARWLRDYRDCKASDVDWEAYLFNRPHMPFDARLLRQWQLYNEFTNGLSGLWMSHYVDAVHMLLGAHYPQSATALGGTFVWKENRQHCDTFHASLAYPEGFLMNWGMSLGNSAGGHWNIHGTQGTLDLDRWQLTPEGGRGTAIEQRQVQPTRTNSHMANWLQSLRSREQPHADIRCGHQHAVATIMTAAALHTGQRHDYDPATQRLSTAAEAA